MRFLKFVLFLLVMVVGGAFATINAGVVTLDYYFASVTLPLSVVLLGAVAFGALLGCLAMLGSLFRLKRENSELVRKSRLANQELNNLRSIPIKD
ncbi:MAG: DNA recombination protein RecN [Candidatus Sedimenticola endophacoides]|nr:MAG: DNA recombination protein RecN [Candidatus Sedimenticola endophacoides]OQX34123.1 MAG: DNA recombination protein RecN [Candidatus Sedimenticola endophacoides]OQX41743.1 MAG: DNA recombination protein RecN [Candidatus Sedimenticola endophacoides]OQX47334.1 MAG: DNA recombination protein RecN [Candidatus Sedimenticola endophacoides]